VTPSSSSDPGLNGSGRFVVAVTLIGIYYQFRLQRAAATFKQLNRLQEEWGAEHLARARLRAARAIQAGKLVPSSPAVLLGNFCEAVASLIRHGHVNAQVVYETIGPSILSWWILLEDTVMDICKRENDPTTFVHFEWLAHTLEALAGKDQVGPEVYVRASVFRALPGYIERYEENIRIAEESRGLSSLAARRRQK
jgi:hypothetical protein